MFRLPLDYTEGAKTLTSCFVPTFVWYPGDSYPNSDDSYPSNWLFRTHFVCGANSFHQPGKQRLTVSVAFSDGTLNSAEKKSRRRVELHTLVTFTWKSPNSVPYLWSRGILQTLYTVWRWSGDSRHKEILKTRKSERMRVIYIVYVIESAAYGVICTSCLCQKPERARYERVRAREILVKLSCYV